MKANEIAIHDMTKYGRVVGVWEPRAGKIKILLASGKTVKIPENQEVN